MTHKLLFVYGTLLLIDNEFGTYLHQNSTFYAKGKFNGRLYHLGQYPGAVYDEKETGFVYGTVYSMIDPHAVLEKLDEYEGIGKKYRQPYEYMRRLLTVSTEIGPADCWVYIYNLDEKDLEQIVSGMYI